MTYGHLSPITLFFWNATTADECYSGYESNVHRYPIPAFSSAFISKCAFTPKANIPATCCPEFAREM